MDREAEIAVVRRAYAKQILTSVNVIDARLEEAFASIPREHYLDPGALAYSPQFWVCRDPRC
jgi:protein-L-isoaspartate(D-aspartate) O-methyltransferase